jgi:PAS domain S-box-containing protein
MEPDKTREEMERLASFPQLNPNPVIEVDYSGKITFMNAATEKVIEKLGIGKGDAALLPSDLGTILRDMATKGESLVYREIEIKGRIFELAILLAPLFNVARIYGRDITARRQVEKSLVSLNSTLATRVAESTAELRAEIAVRAKVEQELRESEERYRSMFEKHHAIMVLVDPESGQILDANAAAAKFYGYEVSRLRHMTISEINTLPADETTSKMQEVVNGLQDFFVVSHRLSNGEVRTVEVRSSLVPYQGKKVLFSIVHDITARQLMEHERSLMLFALNHVSEEVLLADKGARIHFVNETACRALGYSKDELLKLRVADIDPNFQMEAWAGHWRDLKRRGSLWLESRHRAKDGRLYPVEMSSSYFEYEGGSYIFGLAKDITERKQTENALRKSEADLQEAQRIAQIGSWEWDATADIISWSQEYYRIFGHAPGQPTPNYLEHLKAYTAESAGRLDTAVREVMESGSSYELDLALARPTGTTQWICARGEAIRDKNGRITGLRGTAQNITERKRTEHKIARLNQLYAVLSRTNEEVIRTFDAGDLYAKACRILAEDGLFRMAWIGIIEPLTGMVLPVAHSGYAGDYLDRIRISVSPDAPEGKGPTGTALREGRFFVNNDTQNNSHMLPWREEALKRGYLSSAAIPIKTGKSTLGVLTVYAGEADYFDDEIVSLITSLADDIAFATQHRRAEKETAFLASVVENVPDAVCSIDTSGHIFSWNKAAEKMLGYTREEIIGKHITVTIPRELAQKELDHCMGILNAEGSFSGYESVRLAKNGGMVPVEITAVAMKDEGNNGTAYVAIMRDVTEKKKLEGQLRHSQKMEAIGTLAGGIAHDFNNILNIIVGYGTMVGERLGEDQLSREAINEVLSAADRATNLTKRLLVFSRKQVVEMKPVNIDEIIAGMEKMVSRIIGEDIFFSIELAGRGQMVKADAGHIEHVLMNLVTNARDAMPKGGRLTIATEIREIDDGYIAAHGYGRIGTYILITVTDTGSGMDEETQKKIFEPFFTTKEVGRGTGLGLAMAYGTIKQHEGYIQVYSEEGKGSTFRILLPVIRQEALSDRQVEAATPVKGGSETILIAEDDPSLRKLMQITLESLGYSVIASENGEDAIAVYQDNRDSIRLVILDMIMPRKNGKEAYEEIRKINPDVKTLFVSGYTMDIAQRKELLDEGMDFLLKPIAPKDLLRKVRETLDR